MGANRFSVLLRRIDAQLSNAAVHRGSDRQLLERFVADREEKAFSALLSRYGSMVLHVCRRVLPEPHDAEDAFQATFLLLVKKAGSIRKRESVASWLHGTAYRLAVHLRRQTSKRKKREQEHEAPREAAREPGYEAAWRELQAVVDEELAQLPDRFRAPLLLCYFQGQTQEEAARQLGWPLGTVRSRVARAREALRVRLKKRGLAVPAVVFGAAIATRSLAAVPGSLMKSTLAAGLAVARGKALAGLVSAQVAALIQGVQWTMSATKFSLGLTLLLTTGLALACLAGPATPKPEPQAQVAAAPLNPDRAPQKAGKGEERARARHDRDALGDALPPGARARLGTLRLFTGTFTQPVFTPDSHAIVASDPKGALHFWDVASGREVRRLEPPTVANPQVAVPNQLAFSQDGRQVVTLHGQAEIQSRDAATGRLVQKFTGQGELRFFALAPDGRFVAASNVAYDDKAISIKVLVWDAATGKSLPDFVVVTLPRNFFFGFGNGVGDVRGLAFSPDGKYGAAGLGDGGIRLWEVATGKEVRKIDAHRSAVARVAFAPDGKTVASIGPDEFVRLWDVATGEQVKSWEAKGLRRIQQFDFQAHRLAFSDSGKQLVLSGRGPVRVWDAKSGEEVRVHGPDLQGYEQGFRFDQGVFQVLSPDGKALATAQQNQQQGTRLRLHDPATGTSLHDFALHDGPIQSIAVSSTGMVATGGSDHTVRLWDGQTGKQLKVLRGHVGAVHFLAFSPDGQRLASACQDDRVISVWDVGSGKEVRQFRWTIQPRGLAFLAGGKELLVMGKETVWDVETGKMVREIKESDGYRMVSTLTPDGRLMASSRIVLPVGAGFDRAKIMVHLSEPANGREVGSFEATTQEGPRFFGQMALAPGGHVMVGRYGDRPEFVMLDTASGRSIRLLPRPGGVAGDGFFGNAPKTFFTPDGRLLVHPGQQGKVHVLELASGEDRRTFEAAPTGLTALALSPDGKTLVTAGTDGTALLWDIGLGEWPDAATALDKDLDALWAELAGEAPKAGQALAALAANPAQAVSYLAGRLKPAVKPDLARIGQLIKDLDSDQFKVRKNAETELDKIGFATRPLVEKALQGKPSLDVHRRLEALLTKLETTPLPPAMVQQLRGLEVLEAAGTPPARQVIEKLAGGAAGEPLTIESQAALARMGR
jgi:RNA polymerase sigma factor (sigma-70 family)